VGSEELDGGTLLDGHDVSNKKQQTKHVAEQRKQLSSSYKGA
jgi:hypothetical protein